MVNVSLCQAYPSALEGLTLTEECLIAKCHPLGVVLELRPGGHLSPVNYHALRGHFIVILQDPGPLLNILPSPELAIYSLIKVFWLGARPPLLVRKAKVLAALQYLVQYNPLYRNLTGKNRKIKIARGCKVQSVSIKARLTWCEEWYELGKKGITRIKEVIDLKTNLLSL
jgi:hypothetical protein